MNVTLVLEREFQGVVFARDFALQCRAVGSREKTVTLHLTASGCGVRITPNKVNINEVVTYYFNYFILLILLHFKE